MANNDIHNPPTVQAPNIELGRASIVAGIALVVGTLAAVGVQGDFLPRAVRQAPFMLGIAFTLVIVGLVLPFPYTVRWRNVGGLLLAALGVLLALWLGIYAIWERETPAVSLTITPIPDSASSLSVTAEASATSLSPPESAMLRVVAIGPNSAENAREICESSQSDPNNEEAADVNVLSWGTAGPDVSGKVLLASSLTIAALEYQYVCARVALLDRSLGIFKYLLVGKSTNRAAWVIVDLEAQRSVLASSN